MRFYLTSHSVSSSSFELANAFRSILPPVSRLATHNCGGGRISRETSPRLAEAHSLTSAPNREWAPLSQTLLNAPRFFFCLFRNIWAAAAAAAASKKKLPFFNASSPGAEEVSHSPKWLIGFAIRGTIRPSSAAPPPPRTVLFLLVRGNYYLAVSVCRSCKKLNPSSDYQGI